MTCFVTSKISFVKNEILLLNIIMKIQKFFFRPEMIKMSGEAFRPRTRTAPEYSRTGNFVEASEFSQEFAPVWNANPELCGTIVSSSMNQPA